MLSPNPPKLDCSISMCVGIDEECNLCLDYQDGDPGAIIALSLPGVIHRVLGLLPPIVTIPPDINPPPAVPLQQGKTSSMFSGGFFCDAMLSKRRGIAHYSGTPLCA